MNKTDLANTYLAQENTAATYAIMIVEVASSEEVITEIIYDIKAATICTNVSADVAVNTYKAYILM